MNTQYWALVKQAANAGILQGGNPYAGTFRYVAGVNSPIYGQKYNTIAQALAACVAGDIVVLGPQTYAEGGLSVTVNNILIVGAGNRGECSIAPTGSTTTGLNVKSTGVTMINVDVAGGSSAAFSMKAGFETTASLNRFTAYKCKFESALIACLMHGMSDTVFEECEFAWSTHGLQFQSNSHGFCTEVLVRKCLFHDNVTADIDHAAAAQEVDGLWVQDCLHTGGEGGVAPTKFINLSDNGNTGIFTGNKYANATNQASKLTIGSGLLWVANATEAGYSTARPA